MRCQPPVQADPDATSCTNLRPTMTANSGPRCFDGVGVHPHFVFGQTVRLPKSTELQFCRLSSSPLLAIGRKAGASPSDPGSFISRIQGCSVSVHVDSRRAIWVCGPYRFVPALFRVMWFACHACRAFPLSAARPDTHETRTA